MKILGIDLAGKEDNPSGISIFDGYKMDLSTVYSDRDIIKLITDLKPSVIVIDAPLSLPKGRCCLEKDCKCAVGGHFRQAEKDIRQYGRVLPLTFRGMKMLTFRGIRLASELKSNYELLESHPRTCQKILKFKDLLSSLNQFIKVSDKATAHELDAGVIALTGYLYLNNCCIELGDPDEGLIIIPKNEKCLNLLM
jgi:predicted nuclease with RNAse H fold